STSPTCAGFGPLDDEPDDAVSGATSAAAGTTIDASFTIVPPATFGPTTSGSWLADVTVSPPLASTTSAPPWPSDCTAKLLDPNDPARSNERSAPEVWMVSTPCAGVPEAW